MNLTVFGLLVAYGVDSGAIMATSVFKTIRVLRPKWSGPELVILRGAYCIGIRGGVENTRLEAKAKDSLSEDRHSRGQGHECSRPRPRTKDTAASVLQKKGLQKFFQAISNKCAPRIFDWGRPKPQITWNDVIKFFPKKKFL